MRYRLSHWSSRANIPNPAFPVGNRHGMCAIGTEIAVLTESVFMLHWLCQRLTCVGVPNASGTVAGSSEDQFPVGAELRVAYSLCMNKLKAKLPGGGVPQPGGVVPGSG